jgi:mycofactocin system glycosyltransferase
MKYRLAAHVELMERDGEHLLVSRNPLCILKVNRSLADLFSAGRESVVTPASPGVAKVLEQLAGKGFVERERPLAAGDNRLPTISVVIPVKDRAGELGRCLESIANMDYPRELVQVIVVDDGSTDSSASVAASHGALVVPSGGTGRGPAAARNVGARLAGGEILAFIDSDCTASTPWLAELLPAFSDPKIVAVGGLVDGMCMESAVDRYESVMSSLSLGGRELTGGAGNDTFYLPSCNLLVRRSPFLQAGGFNDLMHVGEDVDLTWRLRDQGWTIAYLPVGRVFHEHRSSIRSFMSRRFDYGTSEGTLQRLHPERHKRMVIPPLLALILVLCVMAPYVSWWLLVAGGGLLAADATLVRVRMRTSGLPVRLVPIVLGRLRALGSLGYYLSYHLVRYYALSLILVALVSPALIPLLAVLFCCAAGVDHGVRKPPLSRPVFAAIYLLEQLAYGSGVFWGCLKGRTFASYRVEILRQVVLSA